ncbi:hypothetical protein CDFC105_83938 [Clostridioides difficile]|nr:hypothetical protein CDFC105_83938 [Clostridioides difficile]
MGLCFFFFQAEDGIRDVERSRGLGDVYKRQLPDCAKFSASVGLASVVVIEIPLLPSTSFNLPCLLYTSDAADDSLRVDLCGRRIL